MSKNAVMPLKDYVAACDTIRDKTGTTDLIKSGELADKIEDVYNAEWEKIKGTASGNPICIDDISPIAHEMSVKVSGVEDLSTVKVSKYGRNLLDFPSVFSWKGAFFVHQHTNVKTVLKPNVQYVLLYDGIEYSKQGDGLVIVINDADIAVDAWGNKPWYFTLAKEVTEFYMYTNGRNAAASSTTTATIKNLRIYVAETDYLEYEPYIEPVTYTADENGIVSGVTSLYPTTTLMTDTDGAVIEVTYNKDISKVEDVPERIEGAYENGIESGKGVEWNKFWDAYQSNGTRRKYGYAFYGEQWNDITFRPKYDIIINGSFANEVFSVFQFSYITDLAKICEEQGIKIDGSNCSSVTDVGWFGSCFELTRTPPIPIGKDFRYSGFYQYCIKLHTVEGFYVHENQTMKNNNFQLCNELQNLTIVGTIGQSGLDLHWSEKLTHDSLMNVINCLMAYIIADNMDIPSDQTVTLMSNAKLIEGKNYKVFYNDDGGYGWQLQNGYTKVCEKMTVNGTETLGIKYEVAHPAGAEYEWYIIVYQDGNDIKLTVNDAGNIGQSRLVSLAVDQTATHSVTLGATNLAKLTDAEKAIATQKGWTLL